jgi:hypothetical protein
MKLSLTHVLLVVILVLGIAAFFLFTRDAASPGAEPTGAVEEPTAGPTLESATAESEGAPCPEATPEFFAVEPVTSPTGELSQIITVDLGNGEAITITTESGTFAASFDTFPKEIEIDLLPDTTHNLTVEGKVREVMQGDCTYGGYTLRTTTDRYGDPLVIEQQP